MTDALVSKQQPSLLTIMARRQLGRRRQRLSATFCLVFTVIGTGLFTPQAGAQSRWQKIKMQLLGQACKGGDQNACQQLAKMNQKQVQPARAGSVALPPGQQTPGSAGAETQSSPVTAAAQGGSGGSESAAAWTPPTEESTPAQPAGPLDPMKLPDIQGFHLGMTVAQANEVVAHLPPGPEPGWYNEAMLMPTTNQTIGHAAYARLLQYDWIDMGNNGKDSKSNLALDVTEPPDAERIWHIGLLAKYQHVNRAVLLAALRKKYGHELSATTFVSGVGSHEVHDDSHIEEMWWAFDEQGRPLSPAPSLGSTGIPNDCSEPGALEASGNDLSSLPSCMWVGVYVHLLDPGEIINNYQLVAWDPALRAREKKVTSAWANAQLEKARKAALQKSKETKPTM